MRASRFTIQICSVITAGLVAASSPPAHGQPRGAAISVDIPYEQFVLPNGLRVLVHTDHKAPIVAVNITSGTMSGPRTSCADAAGSPTCSST